jgi:hypothetical protein
MLLDEGEPEHQDQGCDDKSAYGILHHGCHSMRLGTRGQK